MSEFLEHDDARRNRILEAALQEFSERGYKKASTNTIVREAKVSKGLLFHYFINKKELYIYLYNYATQIITNEIYEGVNFADRDVLNRLSATTLQKIKSYGEHPLFVKLFENHVLVEDEDIIERTKGNVVQLSAETYGKLFNNIDYFFFNDRINITQALKVVRWTIDRISSDWLKSNNYNYTTAGFNQLNEEISIYLNLFRDAFYK